MASSTIPFDPAPCCRAAPAGGMPALPSTTRPPRYRVRADRHRLPVYYGLRNHLMDFLATRSATFRDELAGGLEWNAKAPPLVEPLADAVLAALAATETDDGQRAAS